MGKWLFNNEFQSEGITYKEKLVKLVSEGKSGKQICKEMQIDYVNMHRWLRKLGINLPNYHNELKFDNTVFDTIDTEEKAYWLGFLYADGYVSSTCNTVELSLKGGDIEHLEKYRKFLGLKREIKTSLATCNNKDFTRCRLVVTDKHYHDTLISKGCVPNKSPILKFPNKLIFSSVDLIIHFIRGYFDGDGCVYKGSGDYSIISIVGTKEFLSGVVDLFPNLFSSEPYYKNKRRPKSNTYFISFGGEKSAIFGDLLYDNATIYLQRKYDTFIKYKYDKRESFRRMHTFSEKRRLYYNRGGNWLRKDSSCY